MPTRIILVRHGQSTFNAAKRFQGCNDDSVLTETGRFTAAQTGLALRSVSIDAIYVSPLQRTQATAQEILSRLENRTIPVRTHPNLKEVHLPEWEGLAYQDVRSRFADAYRQWQDAPHQLQMELPQPSACLDHGQTAIATLVPPATTFLPLPQLYAQAEQFWQEILPNHRDQTLLVISHGGTIRALISTAIGLDISCYHTLQQSNSSMSELIVADPQQPAQLQTLNLTHHLGEVLPKLKNGKQGIRMILLPLDRKTPHLIPLATRLRSIPVDVCVTDSSDRTQSIATNILSQHPQSIIQLQVNQSNFLHNWHQTIHPKIQAQTGLCTVLIITDLDQINSFLHRILNLPEQDQTLVLQPETLSILFYPTSTHHPVLQAMNLGADSIGEVLRTEN